MHRHAEVMRERLRFNQLRGGETGKRTASYKSHRLVNTTSAFPKRFHTALLHTQANESAVFKSNLATQLSDDATSLFRLEGMGISPEQREAMLWAGRKQKLWHKSAQLETLIVVQLPVRSELIESGLYFIHRTGVEWKRRRSTLWKICIRFELHWWIKQIYCKRDSQHIKS